MTEDDVLMSKATRKIAYKTYGWLTILLGGVLAGYAAVQIAPPVILVGILAGLTFVGGALGFVAAANVTPTATATGSAPMASSAEESTDGDGDGDGETVVDSDDEADAETPAAA